jgi:hypothetical protein
MEERQISELQGIARFKFDEGSVEEFKRLSARCVEIVQTKDTGTLQYEIYLSEDESEAIVCERYRDSDALFEHSVNLGDIETAILATGSVSENCSVSRARISVRTWRTPRCESSRPICRCDAVRRFGESASECVSEVRVGVTVTARPADPPNIGCGERSYSAPSVLRSRHRRREDGR